ncbi:MAG: DUF5069 domain-containing protein [Nitrospira sp. CG24D]|nr:MAG: DUF5069 domain-containing protein [Nitrospira sp. CG24D]
MAVIDVPKPGPLRSLGETLGVYILLPHLIDKVHLFAKGELPLAYAGNVLGTAFPLDGRFPTFPGLNAEALRQVAVRARRANRSSRAGSPGRWVPDPSCAPPLA